MNQANKIPIAINMIPTTIETVALIAVPYDTCVTVAILEAAWLAEEA